MLNGICILPVIPMRKRKSDTSEMINQILFGESFKVLKKQNKWSYIELLHDQYQGWIDNSQYIITKKNTQNFIISNKKYSNIKIKSIKQTLLLGSFVPQNKQLRAQINIKENLHFCTIKPFDIWFKKIANKYLNTPYLWGGRSPMGIDCSGYTQMVYRFFNIQLPRDAHQQEKKGAEVKNIQKIKVGDLAFFEKNKAITHVGVIIGKNKIIHASGKVRVDLIDKKGIFNLDSQSYSHKLKSLKRVFDY